MIFVTADTHGQLERFSAKDIKRLKKTDTLIILGDFGFVWKSGKETDKILKKIAKKKFKTLFIDGKHENFALLRQYPQKEYMGATVRELYKDKIYYIERGEILNIEGKSLLCFGGSDIFDPDFKLEQNLPTLKEFENCVTNLEKYNRKVDYILTHMPSGIIHRFLKQDSSYTGALTDFFDKLSENADYTRWYFGSMHIDKYVTAKTLAVYEKTVEIKD